SKSAHPRMTVLAHRPSGPLGACDDPQPTPAIQSCDAGRGGWKLEVWTRSGRAASSRSGRRVVRRGCSRRASASRAPDFGHSLGGGEGLVGLALRVEEHESGRGKPSKETTSEEGEGHASSVRVGGSPRGGSRSSATAPTAKPGSQQEIWSARRCEL